MSVERDPLAPQENPRTRIPLRIEEVLLASIMAAIALITGANVVTRYTTNMSLAFTEEYSVALMVGLALIGTALAMAGGRHIRIAYFTDLMPKPWQRRFEIGAMLLVILCFGMLAGYGAVLTWQEYDWEILSSGLGHPQWLYTGWMPVLSLFVIGRAAGRIMRLARGEDG